MKTQKYLFATRKYTLGLKFKRKWIFKLFLENNTKLKLLIGDLVKESRIDFEIIIYKYNG